MAAHHDDDHPKHLAHHFSTVEQQYASAKLGMWVFLATEVLMFGGLFCGYAVYYANHPDIFEYGHQYLDKVMGGINTVVLICSSLTMAWGVRAAQLGQQKLLAVMLALTILGGFGFMGIKAVEYKHKWHEGLLPGVHYKTQAERAELHGAHGEEHVDHGTDAGHDAETTDHDGLLPGAAEDIGDAAEALTEEIRGAAEEVGEGVADAVGGQRPEDDSGGIRRLQVERSALPDAAVGPQGIIIAPPDQGGEPLGTKHEMAEPEKARLFFSWYFGMTGLHAIHVLVGMGLIGWILVRALRHEFGPHYYTPVDLVGLYWHLVDLIWIFLFPLLYLVE